jgi:hypothetical protein
LTPPTPRGKTGGMASSPRTAEAIIALIDSMSADERAALFKRLVHHPENKPLIMLMAITRRARKLISLLKKVSLLKEKFAELRHATELRDEVKGRIEALESFLQVKGQQLRPSQAKSKKTADRREIVRQLMGAGEKSADKIKDELSLQYDIHVEKHTIQNDMSYIRKHRRVP